MISQFPGTCGCGCRKAFPRGAQVDRGATGGWVLTTCTRPAPARPDGQLHASPAEVRAILAQARAVAARADAAAAARTRPAP